MRLAVYSFPRGVYLSSLAVFFPAPALLPSTRDPRVLPTTRDRLIAPSPLSVSVICPRNRRRLSTLPTTQNACRAQSRLCVSNGPSLGPPCREGLAIELPNL